MAGGGDRITDLGPRSMLGPNGYFECVERPITVDEACSLRLLLLGNTQKSFGNDWKNQSFTFREDRLSYGLIQHRSGPCGVLAAVQANVLCELLYGSAPNVLNYGKLKPDIQERKEALVRAISNILHKARYNFSMIWVVRGPKIILNDDRLLKRDGLLEYLWLKQFTSKSQLQNFLYNIADELMESRSRSCVTLLYSVLLTRGIDNVKQEMDDANIHLIGRDGFCSQELMNLLLVGKAVSNVFDGEVVLESDDDEHMVLHGISEQSKIGLLHVFEYQNNSEVGEFYKNPKFPVWIVGTQNHFSVLFGMTKDIFSCTHVGDRFRLYHYDGIAFGENECIYDIEMLDHEENPERDLSLPPAVKCILTRWPNGRVFFQT